MRSHLAYIYAFKFHFDNRHTYQPLTIIEVFKPKIK